MYECFKSPLKKYSRVCYLLKKKKIDHRVDDLTLEKWKDEGIMYNSGVSLVASAQQTGSDIFKDALLLKNKFLNASRGL